MGNINLHKISVCLYPCQIPPTDLFHQVEVRGIQATSLSAMYDGKELDVNDALEVEPMEVNTYRVKFH